MKKFLSTFSILSLSAILFSGCLKDKGYEENKYGINSPENSPPAVGFKNALSPKNTTGVNSTASAQTIEFVINYTGGTPPATDVTVNIAVDNSLIAAYNTANGTTIQVAPAGAFTVPASVVIPAGQRFAVLKLVLNSTNTLDPLIEYGIGLRITGASNGIAVAQNLSAILVTINIKNKYDGKYSLTFSNYHPSLNPGYIGGTTPVELRTTGPNSVSLYWPLADGLHTPAFLSGSLTYFGNQALGLTINPTTNKVTVQQIDPAGSLVYNMNSSFDSRWEDGPPKKLFAKWGYNNPGGVFVPGTTREWTQTFTYTGPR